MANKYFFTFIFILGLFFTKISYSQLADSTNLEKEQWIESVMHKMSLDEKIGQLFMVAAYSNKDEQHTKEILYIIKKYKIGGLIFFQGGPMRQANLTNLYQSKSKIPLLIAIDGEWGLGMRLDSTISYPRQMMLGAIQDDSLVYNMGRDIAEQMKRLGIHVNFAPVVDINNNPDNPVINARSFGEDRDNVSNKSIMYMKGMQDAGLLTTAKHFPGHGDTDKDSHYTLPSVTHNRERLDSIELYSFKKIFEAGANGVMVAHLNVPALGTQKDTPTTLTKSVVTDLLKDEMGFNGLIFTDALNMKGVTNHYEPGEIECKALEAGNDVMLFSVSVSKAISKIKKQIRKGVISKERIDESCRKVLAAKYDVGLYNSDRAIKAVETNDLYEDLNKLTYNVTKSDLVNAGLTLIRNNNDFIPIKNLKRKKFASVAFNVEAQTDFQTSLSKYALIDHYICNDYNKDSIVETLQDYDVVFASVHNTSLYPGKNYKVDIANLETIAQISENSKVALTLFASPYSLRKFRNIDKIDALLIGYADNKEEQHLAAQAMFGGVIVNGKLPVGINSEYPVGFGINTKKKIRLEYGSPEQAGIDSDELKKIDSIALNAIENMATPGCRILAARKGIVFYNKSFGYHTYLKENPVKDNDIYDIASITKIIATVPMLMRMYEDSTLHIKGTLADYLPELDTTNKGNLVIEDILTHQARLNGWIPFYYSTLKTLYPEQKLLNNTFTEEYPYKLGNHAYIAKNTVFKEGIYSYYPKENYTTQIAKDFYIMNSFRDSIYDKIRSSYLLENNGYKYSDLGYYYFYKIIENTTGALFQDYVDTTFYQNLGTFRTTFLPLNKFSKSEIVPTENDQVFRKQLVHGYVHDPGAAMLGGVCGHAGVFSTANDLAIIMQMYLNGGEYGGQKFFDSSTLNLFTKAPFLEQDNRRALGFDKPQMDYEKEGPTCKCVSGESYGHSGFTGTIAWVDPEEEIVYIFLSNRIHPDQDNGKLIRENVRTEIQQVIYDAILNKKRIINY